jgi:LuxR family transcriptional regulator, maltose regulon positive regulatory protein
MHTILVATKLRIPPQPHHVVRRARLINALEESIPRNKLILISAPAGYGKTTLLSQWAHASRFPIVWLSAGEEDNDFEQFLRYLLAGWEEIQPGVRESPLGLLLGAMEPDSAAVLSAFINAANDAPNDMVFVLDDYHLIEEPSIHAALTFLLDHLPPTLHFILAGRAEPPLPLARYRARHELEEFRADDLQFVLEETTDFLNQRMRLDFTHEELGMLQARLEGWIAGLQLVAISRQRRLTATDKPVVRVSGRHRFIADYLSENVLADLPDSMQQFLLRTSILDRLCSSLCVAVTERDDGQAVLETLERENLFLVPLDDQREWYRYHQLFAEFLRTELQRRYPEESPTLHRRAAEWYLARDLPEQAFSHAVACGDIALVTYIFERYVPVKLVGGEVKVVQRWVESLPEAWYSAEPMLGFARACVLVYTGQFDAGIRYLDEVERRVQGAEMRQKRARLTALRCILACYQNELAPAEAFAQQALRDLAEEDIDFRNGVYGSLGDTYRRNGRWEEAKACYLKTLDFPHAPTFHVQSVVAFGALADLDLGQGHLQGAAAYWRRALAIIGDPKSWGHLPLPLIGWVYIRMGEILYEWNELETASEHVFHGLERAELGGDIQGMIVGCLMAARLKLASGDIAAASARLEQARLMIEQGAFPDWIGRFERLQLELWLAQSKLHRALVWADGILEDTTHDRRPSNEETRLAVARALIAKGDASSFERALALLRPLLQAAEAEGRAGIHIEALVLQALARWRLGEHASAMTALERALRLAEPEGYARLFADLGLPVARLLQEARSREVMLEYVKKLLTAFDSGLVIPASVAGALPEPLSLRELDVLRLIAAGLTNREIAEALVISAETVKKHTSAIYSKLGVGNRTEAAGRARELNLLG